MRIEGRKVLVLGGWGLVGMAVCRGLITRKPSEIVILSLEKWQAEDAVQTLRALAPAIKFTPVWGNMFVRDKLKDLSRVEILENAKNREKGSKTRYPPRVTDDNAILEKRGLKFRAYVI